MRGSRKFSQRGFKFDNVFLVDEGIEDPNTAINGPLPARQQNAIEMAFRWRADARPNIECWLGSFVIFSGDPDQYCKETLYFVIFQGGPDPLPPSPGSAHAIT